MKEIYVRRWCGFCSTIRNLQGAGKIIIEDPAKVHTFFKSWYLTLNSSKETFISFHLNNREAKRKLNLVVDGDIISCVNLPKYLDIKLVRTSTFKQRLEGIKNKMKPWNNIINKLTKISRESKANVLRILAFALVYSV